MRFNAVGVAIFEKGLGVADGQSINSNSSGALAFYKPFDGVKAAMSFRGASNSALAEFVIGAYYHDGSWHQQNVGVWVAEPSGAKLGVNTQTPSTTLHVNGPVRVGSYTVATVPSAASVGAGSMIYVSDEIGGPVMAFSDGTNWRRTTDRAVVG